MTFRAELVGVVLVSILIAAFARPVMAQPVDHVYKIEPGPQASFELIARLIEAQAGDVIELGSGTFQLDSELNILASHITLRGQGPDKTILSFRNQRFGSGGILARGDGLEFADFSIQDTAGNGIKVHAGQHVTFRRIAVEWTDGPRTENGAYGIYPVECQHVLIEHCRAQGASDAGIYVGQCKSVIVRHCLATQNVAGIEIENTLQADVHDNRVIGNTGGLLVFDLPGLNVINGGSVRLFNNRVEDNNLTNFAPAGTMVADVPTGTGVMILGTDQVEVFRNTIRQHQTVNVLIASYFITQRPAGDSRYDPFPEGINLHDNVIEKGGYQPQGSLTNVLVPVLGQNFPDVIYDGFLAPNKLIDNALPAAQQLRMENNGPITFANIHLDQMQPDRIASGEYQVDRDASPWQGKHASLTAVTLPAAPARPPADGALAAYYQQLPRTLSGWHLFEGPLNAQRPAAGVLPYELNTALFSDYTVKLRFIRLPAGEAMQYDPEEVFTFPAGTTIVKTFGYPRLDLSAEPSQSTATAPNTALRLLETRVETLVDGQWRGFSYVWNDEQTDAHLALGGAVIPVSVRDSQGTLHAHDYHVPNANQCVTCHADEGKFAPLGPTARNLHRDGISQPENQLTAWHAAGVLHKLPAAEAIPRLAAAHLASSGSLDARARAYLEANCAHCHRPQGSATSTGLDLRSSQTDPSRFGVWKSPVATGRGSGGHRFDIVPGHPEQSILAFRMLATEPAVRMPNLARGLIDHEGVALIEAWIREMPSEEAAPGTLP